VAWLATIDSEPVTAETRVLPRSVADVVGATLAAHGAGTVFGVVGSGNFVVTNALRAGGCAFVAARHECGAVCMADGWARVTGDAGIVSVHQGPGLTNAMTGLAEAAKSGTPMLVLAGDTPAAALGSNFRVDQHDLVASVGAIAERIHAPASAAQDAARALHRARAERRPVVLMLPIDMQAEAGDDGALPPRRAVPRPPAPDPEAVREAAALLAAATRPVLGAGRGAVVADAGPAAAALAARCGALLATSAPAKGLFAGDPYDLGICGGFASPLAGEQLAQADVVLALGARLNPWTTQHGRFFGPDATVIKVDADPAALGAHRPADLAITGDAALAARAIEAALPEAREGLRTRAMAQEIAARRWRDEPFDDDPAPGTVDPRAVSIALEALLPPDRAIACDSGAFLGWPAFYLDVPDARSWVFSNGFQAIGLGLATAIGVAVAAPERVTVAAVGDGGLFMALAELETAARLGLRLLVFVYDDAAYGAEVHHFAPDGHDVSTVRFPDADLAALARAAGAEAITVRDPSDLAPVGGWVREGRGPLVVDAKVDPAVYGAWLADAFRGG
jgi:thiamine pyrophosphate-dependent acetolactate synthase large subunit-like protein